MKDSWNDYSAKVVKQIEDAISCYDKLEIGGYYQIHGPQIEVYKIISKSSRGYNIKFEIYNNKGTLVEVNTLSTYDLNHKLMPLHRVVPKKVYNDKKNFDMGRTRNG